MGPFEFGPFGPGPSPSPDTKHPDIDALLAGAGYHVRESDLRQVADRLELLETALANGQSSSVDSAVHYNPSDLASWVDSLLSEISPPLPVPGPESPYSDPGPFCFGPIDDTWTAQIKGQENQAQICMAVEEEDSGIRLVHALMTCAEAVQRGELRLAGALVDEMSGSLLTRVNTECGIGKVAGYFIDALLRRVYHPAPPCATTGVGFEFEILYHHYYEACPYLKFAHFTANQAILEAFDGCDRVHVIDFSLIHGLQWPALIQALALRPGGPPFLTLTRVGPPCDDGRDLLNEVGLKLTELARSVNVGFEFRAVQVARLDELEPWMVQVGQNEALAVNSIMQLHRVLGSDPGHEPGIGSVLGWIRDLNPKILTLVEQEVDDNKPESEFLARFTEALYYYSTMFDSLAACRLQPEKALAEIYLQREICNIVCCEGLARVERHEPLAKWRARLTRAGFKPVHLGSNAFKQASMLLSLFSAEGYCVEEIEGCLTLGWHSRPLIAASAWQAEPSRESETLARLSVMQ